MKLFNEEQYAVVAHDIPVGLDAESYMQGAVMVLEMLDKEPTLVQCKDCTWFNRGYCMSFDDDVMPNDFCSRGHIET